LDKLEQHIDRLQSKLQELVKQYQTLQKVNAQQQELINKLKTQEENNLKKIKLLEEQQYILKSAAGQLTSTDKKAFEQTINKYIKEIDKCIAMLSE
jgi:hypothetical protein